MTTMILEPTRCVLGLVGRLAVVDQELTTVTSVRDGEVFTAREPGKGLDAETVIVLPMAGEVVEMPDVIPAPMSGHWIGLVQMGPQLGEHISALVLVGSGVQEVVMPVVKADARRIVGSGTPMDHAAMEALLTEARAHRCSRREHVEWIDRLVADAHEEADDRGWCEDFDDFMDRNGLPRRTKDHDLSVEVTATVRISRNAISVQEAIDSITREDVWAAMSADNIEWDAEED